MTIVIRANAVNPADIGMIRRGDGLGFTLEAFGKPGGRDLNRHVAIQTRIARAFQISPMPPQRPGEQIHWCARGDASRTPSGEKSKVEGWPTMPLESLADGSHNPVNSRLSLPCNATG